MKIYILSVIIILLIPAKPLNAQPACDTTIFETAVTLSTDNKLEEAIKEYSKLIKQCPQFTTAYLNCGVIYSLVDQPAKAFEDFAQSIAVAKNKFTIAQSIADFYFGAESYDTAYTYYKIASTFKPDKAMPYFKMGRCKWLGRIPVLLEKYNGDYTKDPIYKSHLKDVILQLFTKAIELDSTSNYEYFYYRGFFYTNFEIYKEGLADFEKSIEIHPVIKAYEYAAVLSKKTGMKDKACKYITQWSTMVNPAEKMNVFQKKEYAQNFCKELGITQ